MSKFAAIQMTSTTNLDKNLNYAEALIKEASDNQAKIIVLPEMFAIVGNNLHDKLKVKEEFGSGVIQSFLKDKAKKYNVWIVGGTIPINVQGDPTKIRAASLVYDNSGNCVARYDKIHLFDVNLSSNEAYNESFSTEPGDKVVVVETPYGNIGLAVCYDIRFPELFREMANKGAQIITLPSAFTMKTGKAHWEILLRARAIENFTYIVAAAQGGTHENGRDTYGHSMIIEPWGEVMVAQDQSVPGVIYADIDLNHLEDIRKQIPVLNHQRLSMLNLS